MCNIMIGFLNLDCVTVPWKHNENEVEARLWAGVFYLLCLSDVVWMMVGKLALYGTVGILVEKNMEQKDFVFLLLWCVFSNHLSTEFIYYGVAKQSINFVNFALYLCEIVVLGLLLQNTELGSKYLEPMF